MPILGATSSGLVDLSFRPNTLPNMSYWLDASQSSTITQSGGVVSQWSDISGSSSRHFVQATTGNRPTLANGGVYFNGSNQFLETSLHSVTTNTLTVFMVVDVVGRGTATTNYGRFYSLSKNGQQDYNNTDGIILYDKAPATSSLSLYRNSLEISALASLSLSTKYVVGFTLSGANAVTYRNSTTASGTTASPPSLNANRTLLGSDPAGADSCLNGRIYEVAVYDRVISSVETNFLISYLRKKWNVTS